MKAPQPREANVEALMAYKLEGALVREVTGERAIYLFAKGPRSAFEGLFLANPIRPDNRCGDVRITQVSLDNVLASRSYVKPYR